MRSRSLITSACAVVAALAIGASGCTSRGGGIDPGTTPGPAPTPTSDPGGGTSFRRGPDPTLASVSAARGPFSIGTTRVTGQSGFAGGVIYYPTDTSQGTFGAVVLAPPYLVNNSALRPFAERYASNGFVVLAFDVFNIVEPPSSRAKEAKAAFDYLLNKSSVRNRIDPNRLGMGGYSMGGGATLEVIRDMPHIKAAVPMVPWNTIKSFPTITVPTMILAGQNDSVAAVATHAKRFYASIPSSTPKGYVEMRGASHFVPSNPPGSMTRFGVAWLKRFVDGDTRYSQFLTSGTNEQSAFQTNFQP